MTIEVAAWIVVVITFLLIARIIGLRVWPLYIVVVFALFGWPNEKEISQRRVLWQTH